MSFINSVFAKLKRHPKRIVFPDGDDPRVIRAAQMFYERDLGVPILLGRRDVVERVALADDTALQDVRKARNLLDLVLHHAPHGDASPIGDNAGDGVGVHARKNQRGFALELLELLLNLLQFGQHFVALFGCQLVVARGG